MFKFRKVIVFLLGLLMITGCHKKPSVASEVEDAKDNSIQESLIEQSDDPDDADDMDSKPVNKIELEIEKAMKDFMPALEFLSEYNFEPVYNYDLKLIDIKLEEENNISFIYDNTVLCTIDNLVGEIKHIYNQCIPYSNGMLYSASFDIEINNSHYYGVINLGKGIVKLYKSLHSDYQFAPPFYSGDSDYFIIENVRIVKGQYYEPKTLKYVRETFGGYIELYNYSTNELVYKIDKRKLHQNVQLAIEKIHYEEDGISATLSTYHDSDEFTDFKLYTADNDFHYEIYDTYAYSSSEE